MHKEIKLFHYHFVVTCFVAWFKDNPTPEKIEKCRNKYFSMNSIKIGRIRAIRKLTHCDLPNAKLAIELSFSDNGNGEAIRRE